MKPLRTGATALTAALTLTLAGCGVGASGDDRTRLTVLAAASLTEPFDELAQEFEASHDGVDVVLGYDSSSTLAAQVVEGAPADVLATADARTMRIAEEAGATRGEPATFATNSLVVVVPAGNPADVDSFADLQRDDVTYVACAESAPCGALARDLLDRNRVTARPRSLEVDVKAVLTKVELDEADAGLVYASDAVAAGDAVETLPVPHASEAPNSYLVAPVQQSAEPDLAAEWVELVLSDRGRQVLDDAGFGGPTP